MEQTDNIEALMDRIKEQESMYEFERIDEELALQMGFYVVRRAREMGKPVATRITLNRRTLFRFRWRAQSPKAIIGFAAKKTLPTQPIKARIFGSAGVNRGSIPLNGVACRSKTTHRLAAASLCASRVRVWWAP